MNKKFILPISLVLLLWLIGFVFAIQMSKYIEGYGTISGEFVEAGYIDFKEGWNLIQGLPSPEWLSVGDLQSSNIKAIFAFNPLTQDYIRFYPNPIGSELNADNVRVDTMINTGAFWVYSNKRGRSKYFTLSSVPINEKRLIAGWNFIGVTPDMIEKSLNDIKGSCTIEKTYVWLSEEQKWQDFGSLLNEKISEISSYGYSLLDSGIVIKVSSNCKFESLSIGGTITPLPQIPD